MDFKPVYDKESCAPYNEIWRDYQYHTKLSALLYLRSDSTTVPLAAAKLRGMGDAFKKRSLKSVFFELIEKRLLYTE